MSKENIYKHFGERNQLKVLIEACYKLVEACIYMRLSNNAENMKLLIRKLANVEFLTEQIKDFYQCEDKVYCRKWKVEQDLLKKMRAE